MVSRIVSHLDADTEFAHSTLGEIDKTRARYKEVVKGPNDGAGLFAIKNLYEQTDPILVSSADGVGFKLMTAILCDKYEGLGKDLVATCINNIISKGAEPLYFLDRLATANLRSVPLLRIKNSVVAACDEAYCALIGGETAENPALFQQKHFDLAGFCVGVIDRANLLGAHRVYENDAVIALPASGLHTAGFSLVHKVMFEKLKHRPNDVLWQNEHGIRTVAEELLTPTKIYSKAVSHLIKAGIVHAITPIMGDGIEHSIKRLVPINLTADIRLSDYEMPRIFNYLKEKGELSDTLMLNHLNMGIGLVLVVANEQKDQAIAKLREVGEKAFLVGIITKDKGQRCQVKI